MPLAVLYSISSIVRYRLSHTVPPPARCLCLLYLQVIVCKGIIYQNILLMIDYDYDFKKTTTEHCSVPMLKRPSDEAGPSS